MKSILIICQHFVPYSPSVGGIVRIFSLVEFLHAHGWTVYLLSSDGVHFGYLGFENIQNKATIIYLKDGLKRMIQRGVQAQLDSHRSDQGTKKFFNLARFAKTVLFEALVPDPGILMVNEYSKRASELIKRHGITNVFISSPPHSMQLVGPRLKQKFGAKINLVVDYRDSWNASTIFKKKLFICNYISRNMEEKILECCDHFTYVSEPILTKLSSQYDVELDSKSIIVMNGFDVKPEIRPEKRIKGASKSTIGYFGYLNDEKDSYRSISKILDAITDQPRIQQSVQFEIYGRVKFERYSIAHFPEISVHGNLPHREALNRMVKMDFLMIVHADRQNSDEVITGKFFEYLSARRPIICFASKNMEASRLIEQYKLGLVVDIDDPDEIRRTLLHLKNIKDDRFYSDIDVDLFARSKQYSKIIDILAE